MIQEQFCLRNKGLRWFLSLRKTVDNLQNRKACESLTRVSRILESSFFCQLAKLFEPCPARVGEIFLVFSLRFYFKNL
jgi:hypothetical protein